MQLDRSSGATAAAFIGSPLIGDVERLLCPWGVTAFGATCLLRPTLNPAPRAVAQVADELDALVVLDRARRVDGQRLGCGGTGDTAWYAPT